MRLIWFKVAQREENTSRYVARGPGGWWEQRIFRHFSLNAATATRHCRHAPRPVCRGEARFLYPATKPSLHPDKRGGGGRMRGRLSSHEPSLHPGKRGGGQSCSARSLYFSAEFVTEWPRDRKSTRLNSSHLVISYA